MKIRVQVEWLSFLPVIACFIVGTTARGQDRQDCVLKVNDFRYYIDYFNRMEPESTRQLIPNDQAWDWLAGQMPLFDCPPDNFEEIYYFRWWTLRKHVVQTPTGRALTEFLVPRSYADQYNLISCAVGHHSMESRWLADKSLLSEYLHVWLRGNQGAPMARLHKFSSWLPYAALQKYYVDFDRRYLVDLLPDLIKEYEFWEGEHRRADEYYWQFDVRDGMEEQISGGRKEKNARPTINSYMAGNAWAISQIARLASDEKTARDFQHRFDQQRKMVHRLWNPQEQFFESVREDGTFSQVREQIGFLPWYFQLAEPMHDVAWGYLNDPKCFAAPFGITTADRSHPQFRSHGCCNCEWDGAVWPFATSQTLTAAANHLQPGDSPHINRSGYFKQFERYVECQYYRGRPYIGEYLDEVSGYWLKGDQERSRYYNHSTFVDLVITGLVGLRPSAENTIEVNPLVPPDTWDWFCLDGVRYHEHTVTILWDRDGTHYHRGAGLVIYVDGLEVARESKLQRLTGRLPDHKAKS